MCKLNFGFFGINLKRRRATLGDAILKFFLSQPPRKKLCFSASPASPASPPYIIWNIFRF